MRRGLDHHHTASQATHPRVAVIAVSSTSVCTHLQPVKRRIYRMHETWASLMICRHRNAKQLTTQRCSAEVHEYIPHNKTYPQLQYILVGHHDKNQECLFKLLVPVSWSILKFTQLLRGTCLYKRLCLLNENNHQQKCATQGFGHVRWKYLALPKSMTKN